MRSFVSSTALLVALLAGSCGRTTSDAPTPRRSLANAASAFGVSRVGPPEKLYQLTGDLDRETTPAVPTPLLTDSRVGLVGTDLGYSFVHGDRLYFYFGDCLPSTPDARRPKDADAIAYVELASLSSDPALSRKPMALQWPLDDDARYHAIRLDGRTRDVYEVPGAGFSDGKRMWVFYYVDSTNDGGYSILGVSEDEGRTFQSVFDVPSTMAWVTPHVVATKDVPGLATEWSEPQTLLMYGRKQENAPVLAAAPLSRVGDFASWRFLAETAPAPTWTASLSEASRVYTAGADYHCRGPFGVAHVPGMDRWLMLERCVPSLIQLRVAEGPLGPWSAPEILFDKIADRAECTYMHKGCDPSVTDPKSANRCCDQDFQPIVYGEFGPSVAAFPYGPFPIEPLSSYDAGTSTATLTFLMSTFNPYSPMVMQVGLRRAP